MASRTPEVPVADLLERVLLTNSRDVFDANDPRAFVAPEELAAIMADKTPLKFSL